jgi:NAD-dependent SIR2 family protein deacetylase
MVVIIGTSGYVIGIAYIAQLVPYSILNNLDADPNIDKYFSKVYIKKATNAIDDIIKDVEEFLTHS